MSLIIEIKKICSVYRWENTRLITAAAVIPLITVLTVLFAAFSAPNITSSNNSLTADAQRWLPKPDVTWFDPNRMQLKSDTKFYNKSMGIVQVKSNLQVPVTEGTYTCIIQNDLVSSVSEATVRGIDLFLI